MQDFSREEKLQRKEPLKVFCSYAHEDETLREHLYKHLRLLERQGLLTLWHDRLISAGTDWARTIDANLSSASLILLLISPDFLASDYCYGIEMRRALERHNANEARVIPILLRPVDWQGAPFAHLQPLPFNGKPITSWKNRDDAFTNVAIGIRQA
jgi:TIR domain